MMRELHVTHRLKWHVLRTKPRKEHLVVSQLRLRDVEVYYPTYYRQRKGKKDVRRIAFFPGYLFVRADLEQIGSNALKWIPGLNGVVQFGGQPAVVAEHIVTGLRTRLSEVQEVGDAVSVVFKKGDSVRVTRGPFSGYSALFDSQLPGRERVRVLLAVLRSAGNVGRCSFPLELDAGDIVKRHRRRRGRRRH